MPLHPYIGLSAVNRPGTKWEKHGTIVAVGQGGTVSEGESAFVACILLLDDGTHQECDLAYVVVDSAEAKARLAKVGA